MRFIAILICILLKRCFYIAPTKRCYSWFDKYVQLLHKYLSRTFIWQSWKGIICILIPVLIVVCLLQYLITNWLFGLIHLIYASAMLFYSLGPRILHQQIQQYHIELEDGNVAVAEQLAKLILEDNVPENTSATNRAIIETILVKSNQELFAVLFWFAIMGPIGAIVYRFIVMIKDLSTEDEQYQNLILYSEKIQNVLDWLPARLTALSYALLGDFIAGFAHLWENIRTSIYRNNYLLLKCGYAAIGLETEPMAIDDQSYIMKTLELTDRALVAWLVFIGCMTLFIWFAKLFM